MSNFLYNSVVFFYGKPKQYSTVLTQIAQTRPGDVSRMYIINQGASLLDLGRPDVVPKNLIHKCTTISDLIYSSSSADNQFPVICPKDTILTPTNMTSSLEKTPFERYWDLYATVPIFLALIMFPMLNFKSPTFFTKFNSLGTISVGFIVIFVAVKSYSFGLNLPNWQNEIYLKPTFTALSGMLSLSYFIHNIIISIMRSNRNQEHNVNTN